MPTFLIVVVFFAFLIIRLIQDGVRRARNAAAPMAQRQAWVIAKRTRLSGKYTTTFYYVSFEFEDGLRAEYEVTGGQFGLLIEGDQGTLFTQGTAFRAFSHQVSA